MEELLMELSRAYGIKFSLLERVEKGSLSENYILVGGGTKYFLKKYRFDNETRVADVHMAKKYFAGAGIPVIVPLPTVGGRTYITFGERFYAVFPFIADRQLEREDITSSASVSLGKMLGLIHLRGKNASLPINHFFKPWDKEKTFQKFSDIEAVIGKLPSLSDFDKLALQDLSLKKKLISENSETYEDLGLESDHLIHGDYLYHNVFFDSDDRVSWVFDFEKTQYCPRTYEIFRSMILSFDIRDTSNARQYLDSYRKIYPISNEELSTGLKLFYLATIYGMWIQDEHYLKNNPRADIFLEFGYDRLVYLSEHFKEFEKNCFYRGHTGK